MKKLLGIMVLGMQNFTKKKIAIVYSIVLLLIVIFPPWNDIQYKGDKNFYGFSSIIIKKKPCINKKVKISKNCSASNFFKLGCPGGPKTYLVCTNLELNSVFLLIEILVASLIFGALFYSNKDTKNKNQ